MPKLRQITDGSYFVSATNGESLGVLVDNTDRILSENSNQPPFTYYSMQGEVKFNTLEEFAKHTGSKVKFVEETKEETSTSSELLEDYPINRTDSVHDVQNDPVLNVPTFRKSMRVNVRYYPGWFIVLNNAGEYAPKLTLSTRNYEERIERGETVHGPYKTFMSMSVDLGKL